MAKIKRVLRCYNCGAVLQSKKKDEKGYIDPKTLAENSDGALFCHSCHEKMVAFNTSMLEEEADEQILKILDDAVASDAIIVWILDLFTFNGTLSKKIANKIKNLKVVAVGTKANILGRHFKEKDLKAYIENKFTSKGIKPLNVLIFGDLNKIDAHDLFVRLHKARAGHDVYMIGASQSGKTSIINAMLKAYTNKSKRVIRSETYPGTSLKVLEIPLNNSSFCYELPGFSLNNSVLGKVERDVQKIITPKKELKITYKALAAGETIMFGSLAGFTVVKGKPIVFKFYTAEKVETKKIQFKNLDEYLLTNMSKRNVRPVSERITTFMDYDMFEYTMENDGKKHEICISGLCRASFISKGQTISIILPKNTELKEGLVK